MSKKSSGTTDLELPEKKKKKKPSRLSVIITIFLVLVLIGSVLLNIYPSVLKSMQYNEFIESGYNSFSLNILDYKDTFNLLNDNTIGNDLNILLSGGNIVQRDGILAYNDYNSSSIVIDSGGTEKTIPNVTGSWMNISDDMLYFRSDMDRDLYGYNIISGQLNSLYSGNIGEIIVSRDNVYYIDYDSDYQVKCYSLTQETSSIVVDSPVTSFAVLGNYIFFLSSHDLFKVNTMDGSKDMIADHVERFFINGRIVIENDKSIVSFSPQTNDSTVEFHIDNNSSLLVGLNGNSFYYQQGGNLYTIHEGIETQLCDQAHELYTSVLVFNHNLYATTCDSGQFDTIILPINDLDSDGSDG